VMEASSGHLAFITHRNGTDALTRGIWTSASAALTTGRWQHLCVTYDGSSTLNSPSIYVDARPIDLVTGQMPSDSLRTSRSWHFGDGGGGVRNFTGQMDDLAIWSTVLSGQEILDLYERQSSMVFGTFS